MARPLSFQYSEAVYHVMARGDGGKVVFESDDDRLVFLKRLEETVRTDDIDNKLTGNIGYTLSRAHALTQFMNDQGGGCP